MASDDPAAGTLDHFSQDLGALAVSELGNVRQGLLLLLLLSRPKPKKQKTRPTTKKENETNESRV